MKVDNFFQAEELDACREEIKALVEDLAQRLYKAGKIKGKAKPCPQQFKTLALLTLTVLVTTIDAQWEGMGDVGSVRYEPALLPPCPTIRVLSYSN